MPIYNTGEKKSGLTKYKVRVNYTDDSGKAHSLTRVAYGLDAAKTLEAQLQKSDHTPSSTITVPELIDLYLEDKRHELRESSVDKSRRILNLYVRPLDIRINKLNIPVLNEWKRGISELDLKHRTKSNIYVTFKALLNWAVQNEYLPNNPLAKVPNFRDAYENKKELRYYTPEEYLRYASSAWSIATEIGFYDYYVFFAIAYYTGARKGEIHALRWHDLKSNSIHITKSITQKLKGDDRETPPKNKSSNRVVQLPEPLIDILKKHKERGKGYKGFNKDYYICGGIRPLRDSTLSKMNFRIADDAGLHHIRIHDFRHSHASLLANNGVNILEISRRLGHSNIEQTLNTYSHFYPQEEDKALSILNKIRV